LIAAVDGWPTSTPLMKIMLTTIFYPSTSGKISSSCSVTDYSTSKSFVVHLIAFRVAPDIRQININHDRWCWSELLTSTYDPMVLVEGPSAIIQYNG
jgi:hypothetical protein